MGSSSLATARNAWNQFVDEDRLDLQLVRPEVADSWRRCRRLALDPFREPESPVNTLELRERLQQKQLLVGLVRPFMENLYSSVRGTGFEIVLTDERGFLLEVLGDDETLARAERVQLCPGGDWSEGFKGTNAIGTAVVERKAVQVNAWEHYCRANHFLTCSACPIFDADGTLLGVLDISGNYRMANPHTLGMVVAAVYAIENQLRLQRATGELYRAYRYSNALLDGMPDGLISVDSSGIVTEINTRAAELFGVDKGRVRGHHVREIPNAEMTLQPVLGEGGRSENREVSFDAHGRAIAGSASLLHDGDGGVIGAVAVFRERTRPVRGRSAAAQPDLYTFDDIVGASPAVTALKEWARMAAASPFTVLISGETGTGKELFAQAIHNASPRRQQPFIAINCAALPDSLVESELFGYEEGSFTGARRGGHAGKFEAANGGTIFLDEIGDMSQSAQMKLLRVIQERTISRVGSSEDATVDVRIIAATHKDLRAEAESGNFRYDLYYRLNVLEIRIPPLRERSEDIPGLAAHLARKIASKYHCKLVDISDGFLDRIRSFGWPGNVRELENVIERAIIRAGAEAKLTADLLDFPVGPRRESERPAGEPRSLRESEREQVSETLALCQGNIQQTARSLGIGRNTLYQKMRKYGIAYQRVRVAPDRAQ
jgi:sigma-54 dependent transcriptional regulator, acetoin dehydrogenase operon transcriptional activator AcoR